MRRRLEVAGIAALALIAMATGAGAASAGSFADPDARVFTLVWKTPGHDGPERLAGKLRALPDGSVLFVRGSARPMLWRLYPDGRLERLGWAGRVLALAVDHDGAPLIVRARRTAIERLDLAARTRSEVADVARAPGFSPGGFVAGAFLAVLADRTVVVSDGERVWRFTADRRFERLTGAYPVGGMVALPDGSYVVLQGEALTSYVPGRAGRSLAPDFEFAGGLTALPDGGLATTARTVLDGRRPTLALVRPDGAVSRFDWSDAATLGRGDGLPLARVPWPTPASMALAADGSLLYSVGSQIRAVVPADSSRPRVAISQSTYQALSEGRVDFFAGTPGTVTLEVLRDGAVVQRAHATATAGDNSLRLRAALPPRRYDLRLRLSTPVATVEARAHVDLRARVPTAEATRAIAPTLGSDGDDAGGAGSELERCEHLAPLLVSCVVDEFEWGSNEYDDHETFRYASRSAPVATASGELLRDGRIRTAEQPLAGARSAPELRFALRQRQRLARALRGRVVTEERARAKLSAVVDARRGDRSVASFRVRRSLTRTLSAGRAWRARLRLSPREVRVVRRWLAAGRRVIARVTVEAEVDAAPGVARAIEAAGVRLTE